jgi:hypothetical protein
MKIMTRKEYENKPAAYRGTIEGKPYLLYADENGTTVYGPVSLVEIIPLTCCCCFQGTHGRQWYNRDTGYGLCAKCANWIPTRGRETPEDMKENYGIEGVHYFLKEITS